MSQDLQIVIDVWWNVGLPLICVASMIANIVNITVLLKLRTKSSIYKHMLWNSVAYLIYSVVCSLVFVIKCGTWCNSAGLEQSYLVKIYDKYFFYYVANTARVFNRLVELWVSVERLLLVKNFKLHRVDKCSTHMLVLLLTVSMLVSLPALLNWRIREVLELDPATNTSHFVYIKELIHGSKERHTVTILTSSVFGWLIMICFVTVNVAVCVLLRQRIAANIQQRAALLSITSNQLTNINVAVKKEMTVARDDSFVDLLNMVKCVMILCVLVFAGNLLHSIPFVVCYVTNGAVFKKHVHELFLLAANSLRFALPGCTTFIYYRFNYNFRTIWRSLVNKGRSRSIPRSKNVCILFMHLKIKLS